MIDKELEFRKLERRVSILEIIAGALCTLAGILLLNEIMKYL